MLVLHSKSGGAINGAKKIMLLRRVEEEWTPIVLKTWASKNISGRIEAKVGGEKGHLGTFAPIKYKVCWKGKKTVIQWGIFYRGR